MIAKIKGVLTELDSTSHTIMLETGALGYEVMVPGYAMSELSDKLGRELTLFCLEYYEGSAMGGNSIPRLVGFPQPRDKAFFQKFITVKGIGIKKALKALARPINEIAMSIEQGDAKMLTTLPEIGKRSAEQIIAELNGKLKEFALGSKGIGGGFVGLPKKSVSEIEREALEILIQLGEKREQAEEMIGRVVARVEGIKSTDALVQAVYRLKGGSL